MGPSLKKTSQRNIDSTKSVHYYLLKQQQVHHPLQKSFSNNVAMAMKIFLLTFLALSCLMDSTMSYKLKGGDHDHHHESHYGGNSGSRYGNDQDERIFCDPLQAPEGTITVRIDISQSLSGDGTCTVKKHPFYDMRKNVKFSAEAPWLPKVLRNEQCLTGEEWCARTTSEEFFKYKPWAN